MYQGQGFMHHIRTCVGQTPWVPMVQRTKSSRPEEPISAFGSWSIGSCAFIFTRSLLRKGRVYKSVCLLVCHHFEISNIDPLYHPRITPDPTYHILMGRGWCQLSSGDVNGTHKDKYKDKYTDKDKYKVLQRPNVCYIFEEQGVLGFQIWHGHGHGGHRCDGQCNVFSIFNCVLLIYSKWDRVMTDGGYFSYLLHTAHRVQQ